MLLIDAGNSRIKSAVYLNGMIDLYAPVPTESDLLPVQWKDAETPTSVFVSNVAGAEIAAKLTRWIDEAWAMTPTFVQVSRRAAGMTTQYDDPTKLGVDRWLAALAAYQLARRAVVVVDAGTAITLDVVSDSGVHLGGSIAPGLELMVDSLTRNTARLRLDSIEHTQGIATNTACAISNGCIDAVVGGIERAARAIATSLDGTPDWVITGGGATEIMKHCHIEFRLVPDLVLQGLMFAASEPV
ncbi:MAG: type III pantothenate kinase [Proteobacteria bacterium]|nr:type III pantothenate kinase [Pseudomonadota bacterium]